MANNDRPVTICLNMICLNDGEYIIDSLSSIQDHVTDYIICDLGSTDGTREKIQLWYQHHPKPGKIFNLKFENFGKTRNEVLELAKKHSHSDYILFMDANMKFKYHPMDLPSIIKKYQKQYDVFLFKINHGAIEYDRTCLIRSDIKAKYRGVTHEYLDTHDADKNKVIIRLNDVILEIYQISDLINGQPKITKDIPLLLEGLIEEPNNTRYMFYLARSYENTGNDLLAIKWFQKRADVENSWIEERYVSLINIFQCHKRLKSNYQIYIQPLFQAIRLDPQRLEAYSFLMNETLYDQFLSADFFHVSRLIFGQFGVSSQIECDSSKYHLFVVQPIYDYCFLYNYATFLQEAGHFSTAIELIDRLQNIKRIDSYLLRIKKMSQAEIRFTDLITEAIIEMLHGRPQKLFSDPVKGIIKIK